MVVFRSATGRLHYAKYNPELDQTFVYYDEYDPSYPAPVIFRWEGCDFDDSDVAFRDFIAAFNRDAKILKQRPDNRNQPGARAVSRVDTGLEAEGLY